MIVQSGYVRCRALPCFGTSSVNSMATHSMSIAVEWLEWGGWVLIQRIDMKRSRAVEWVGGCFIRRMDRKRDLFDVENCRVGGWVLIRRIDRKRDIYGGKGAREGAAGREEDRLWYIAD